MKSFPAAIAFLTRVPVGRGAAFDAADVGHSAGWFPVVGILLGGLYCGAAAALKAHLPVGVVAVVLVLLDALATGALHYDGLADSADGFGGGKNREDVLRIMREHAIGSYGGLALVIAVALKLAAYDALLGKANWIPCVDFDAGAGEMVDSASDGDAAVCEAGRFRSGRYGKTRAGVRNVVYGGCFGSRDVRPRVDCSRGGCRRDGWLRSILPATYWGDHRRHAGRECSTFGKRGVAHVSLDREHVDARRQ